jgi:hypothetical protein
MRTGRVRQALATLLIFVTSLTCLNSWWRLPRAHQLEETGSSNNISREAVVHMYGVN